MAEIATPQFSLAEIRGNIERQDFDAIPDEVVLALVEAVEAIDEWRNAPNVSAMRRGRKRTEKALKAFGLGMLA